MEEHFHKNELAKTECYGQIKRKDYANLSEK